MPVPKPARQAVEDPENLRENLKQLLEHHARQEA